METDLSYGNCNMLATHRYPLHTHRFRGIILLGHPVLSKILYSVFQKNPKQFSRGAEMKMMTAAAAICIHFWGRSLSFLPFALIAHQLSFSSPPFHTEIVFNRQPRSGPCYARFCDIQKDSVAVEHKASHKFIFDSLNLQEYILGLAVSFSTNGAAATKDEERRRTRTPHPSATQEFMDHQHLHSVQDFRLLSNHFLRIALSALEPFYFSLM